MTRSRATLAAYLAQRLAPAVARQYGRAIARYVAGVGGEAAAAGYGEVVGYVGGLRARGLSDGAIGVQVAAVRMYHAWLVATGARADDPTAALRLGGGRRAAGPAEPEALYTAGRLAAWLASIPRAAPRLRAVAAGLLVHQGLAPHELVALRADAVDVEAGVVRAPGAARVRARVLALRGEQVLLIERYVREERATVAADGVGELLVTSRGRAVLRQDLGRLVNGRARGSPVGPDDLRPLRIRQSVIAHALGEGHDVRVVQAFAGHAKASTTAAYRVDVLEDLAVAIARAHPRQ